MRLQGRVCVCMAQPKLHNWFQLLHLKPHTHTGQCSDFFRMCLRDPAARGAPSLLFSFSFCVFPYSSTLCTYSHPHPTLQFASLRSVQTCITNWKSMNQCNERRRGPRRGLFYLSRRSFWVQTNAKLLRSNTLAQHIANNIAPTCRPLKSQLVDPSWHFPLAVFSLTSFYFLFSYLLWIVSSALVSVVSAKLGN